MTFDLRLEPAPPASNVVFGATPFGLIGVRMAKSIGVRDGGGTIRNSEGGVNEAGCFRKPARWVDYSGPVAPGATNGIALFDHPTNPRHPSPFHVRDDGWMGVCLTLSGPLTVSNQAPLHLRYGLWIHDGLPPVEAIEAEWRRFAAEPLPPDDPAGRPRR